MAECTAKRAYGKETNASSHTLVQELLDLFPRCSQRVQQISGKAPCCAEHGPNTAIEQINGGVSGAQEQSGKLSLHRGTRC